MVISVLLSKYSCNFKHFSFIKCFNITVTFDVCHHSEIMGKGSVISISQMRKQRLGRLSNLLQFTPLVSAEAQLSYRDFYFLIKCFSTDFLFLPTLTFTEHC